MLFYFPMDRKKFIPVELIKCITGMLVEFLNAGRIPLIPVELIPARVFKCVTFRKTVIPQFQLKLSPPPGKRICTWQHS